MLVYLLIDTSGSMDGAKIQSVNDTMDNVILSLQEMSNNTGITIDLSVLSFSRDCEWMYDAPKSVLDFSWHPLAASGMTSLGKACIMLGDSLTGFATTGSKIVVIVLSDGCPTDDYDEGIAELSRNGLFSNASRYAIAIGQDADVPSLTRFTDDQNRVFTVLQIDALSQELETIVANLVVTESPLSASTTQGDIWD